MRPLRPKRMPGTIVLDTSTLAKLLGTIVLFVALFLIALVYAASLSKEAQVMYEIGYRKGKSELPPPTIVEKCTNDAAILWWFGGTTNLEKARRNICGR